MIKGLLSALVALGLVLATAGWWMQQDRSVGDNLFSLQGIADVAERTAAAVQTPPPLRHQVGQSSGELSVAEILAATNARRQAEGFPSLTLNSTLSKAAKDKVDDMFAGQYFEHVSPAGVGPADLVTATGYEYIVVGENLALGSFQSDEALVQAWMDSPGHRANILGDSFTEIGLAAMRGQFEGATVWLAVQTFASPLSLCPTPDPSLEAQVNEAKANSQQKELELAGLNEALSAEREVLATLAQQIESQVAEANEQITRGNEFIKQGNEAAAKGDTAEAERLWSAGAAEHAAGEVLFEEIETEQSQYETRVAQFEESRLDHNNQVQQQEAASNNLVGKIKTLNQQIRSFNACIENNT